MKASESIPLHSRFLETVYKSPIQFVDLQGQKDKVADEINAWVDNTTRGLIQEIATPESIETRTILFSQIHSTSKHAGTSCSVKLVQKTSIS